MRKALIASLAVVLFAGCSSMQVSQPPEDTVDHQYVAAVEQAAKRYGTYVVWVNLPQKRATATQ
ncbi:MAG: hypothetical protein ABJA83_13250 [Burkholderiaceae bacterium]